MDCLNAHELSRIRFREVARVAGLIQQMQPGDRKGMRQIQTSAGLLFEVCGRYDPENLLLDQSRREILEGSLEIDRLHRVLHEISGKPMRLIELKRLTPMAFPLWAERLNFVISTQDAASILEEMLTKLKRHGVEHLAIIGDFYHSGIALRPALHDSLASFRDSLDAEIILVRGNHDTARHELLPMVDRLNWSPIGLVHDPADATPEQPTIAGHLHPLCRIGRGDRASRLPCFLLTENLLVLPAFGTFTAGHIMKAKAGQTLHPIANFFEEFKNDEYLDVLKIAEEIRENYVDVEKPEKFGDIIMYSTDGDKVFHSCVYIAADMVFTKNGMGTHQPWTISTFQEVTSVYGEMKILVKRRKP